MGFSSNYYLLLIFCSTVISFLIYLSSIEASNFRPKAIVLTVRKDASTNTYRIIVLQKTPSANLNLTLDLGGQSLWVDCDKDYVSSTYKPVRCGSPECSLAGSNSCVTRPGCNDIKTCALLAYNTVTNTASNGLVGVDVLQILATNDLNYGLHVVSVPKFIFTCVSTNLLEGLGNNVQGMAGLGKSPISLLSQFSSAFGIDRVLAICLTSSTNQGPIFIGDIPYVLLPNNIDFSKYLNYTPLIQNPPVSSDYFIGVESIKINGNIIPLNKKLLKIDENGYGGTKISTVDPYTVMETSIYQAFLNVFDKELAHEVPRVEAVAPFGACFNSTYIAYTAVGRAVPEINLVLQSGVIWRILGANSVVRVAFNVFCLGFVDGGINPRTPIVIGRLQLENNLVQFDVERSRVGFSGTLLDRQTSCENFNFTRVP